MRESPRPLLMDISRTVARARLPVPTGIDRVERAFIRWAMQRDALFLAAFDGRYFLLAKRAVTELLDWLEGDGTRPKPDFRAMLKPQRDANLRAAQSLVRRSAIATVPEAHLTEALRRHYPTGGCYLNVGHDNLNRQVLSEIQVAGLTRTILIHDTIPIDYPEFARAGTPKVFQEKLDAASQADLLIANSDHTAGRLAELSINARCVTAPLGVEPHKGTNRKPQSPPQFLCLGTIEPRKNHALLLSIWQTLWHELGDASPKLILIGRRGWENRDVFQLLDTHPMVGKTVVEAGTPDDQGLADHFATATALLFPSHAEGFGLPLAEALDAGLPCIASDLPALREVGGDVPDYLTPTETAAWHQAILEYTDPNSPRRAGQLARMQSWQRPTWDAHFEIVENAVETILVQSGQHG